MSSFKVVNIGNPGTGTKFGSNDLDLITNMLNGQVASIPPVKIKSTADWWFYDAVLRIRNSSDTFDTTIRGVTNNLGSFDLFLPPIKQNDVLASLGLEQIFSEQQQFDKGIILSVMTTPVSADYPSAQTKLLFFDITDGHLKSIDSTGAVIDYLANTGPSHAINHAVGGTDPFTKTMTMGGMSRYLEQAADMASDSRRVWINTNSKLIEYWDNQTTPVQQTIEVQSNRGAASGYCDLDSNSLVPLSRLSLIGDAQIGAHTTTKISIANRALIPALIAYEDETNIFTLIQKFDAGMKAKPQTVPSTDANYGIFYCDSGDTNKPKFKKPDGTIIDLAAAGASSAPTAAQYVVLSLDATLTQERLLTAGDGFSIVDGGANGNVTLQPDFLDLGRKRVVLYTDFFEDPAGLGLFQKTVSGTGADVTALTPVDNGIMGQWVLTTGTTSTGKSAIQVAQINSMTLGNGQVSIEWYIKIPTLSTSTEEYVLRVGLIDSATGGGTDNACFVYDRTTNVNWLMQNKSNSVSTQTASTTAVGTGWVRLKVVINAAGTSVAYYVNGTQLTNSPVTTNIPVGLGRELAPIMSIIKTVGTTARTTHVDYVAMEIDLTTPR